MYIPPTEFILRTVLESAEQAVAEQCHFSLDEEKWAKLCEALDQPPREIPALRQLFSEKTILETHNYFNRLE